MAKTNFWREKLGNKGKFNLITALIGGLCGVANGFFGGGGGMLVVPLMIYFLKTETKAAHATAILVILPITLVSAIIYVAKGNLDFSLLAPVAAGVTAGGLIGAKVLGKLKVKTVTALFSLIMLAAGIKLLLF